MYRLRKLAAGIAVVILLLVSGEAAAGETARLAGPNGDLYGTLELPSGDKPCAVALVIAGSGPTDRNGNNPMTGTNNSLKLLAEGLAAEGVASLRFDKRGIGESAAAGAREEDLRFDTYIDDAAGWCVQLCQNPRFSCLLIVGHSEGALIGTIAGRKSNVDGVVSIAGTADSADRLLLGQLKPKLPDALYRQTETIVAGLKRGDRTDRVPPELQVLFQPSVQPYLISWFRYDPIVEISKLKVPVLVVHGTTDIQVPVGNAHRLSTSNVLAETVVIEGMNHIFKTVPPDMQQQIKSYGNPDLPVASDLVQRIAAFAHQLDK